jgi:hypothetical protein
MMNSSPVMKKWNVSRQNEGQSSKLLSPLDQDFQLCTLPNFNTKNLSTVLIPWANFTILGYFFFHSQQFSPKTRYLYVCS